jgi:hypothetical protein
MTHKLSSRKRAINSSQSKISPTHLYGDAERDTLKAPSAYTQENNQNLRSIDVLRSVLNYLGEQDEVHQICGIGNV